MNSGSLRFCFSVTVLVWQEKEQIYKSWQISCAHMGVNPKIVVFTPQIIHFNWVFHYKPSILVVFPLFLGWHPYQMVGKNRSPDGPLRDGIKHHPSTQMVFQPCWKHLLEILSLGPSYAALGWNTSFDDGYNAGGGGSKWGCLSLVDLMIFRGFTWFYQFYPLWSYHLNTVDDDCFLPVGMPSWQVRLLLVSGSLCSWSHPPRWVQHGCSIDYL